MKNRSMILLAALLALSGCATRTQPLMNKQAFYETNIGMSEENLIKTYGEPLNKYHRDNGNIIFEYVERFRMGEAERRVVEIRRYYFTIQDGKVISKQWTISNAPAYEHMNELQ